MRRGRSTFMLAAAAASIIPCVLLLVLGSRRASQPRVLEGRSAPPGHGYALSGDIAIAEPSEPRRVWLYSLIGTDFPGDPSCSCCVCPQSYPYCRPYYSIVSGIRLSHAAGAVTGAATLLQHWMHHYLGLGFGRYQMLLVVHSNSNGRCSFNVASAQPGLLCAVVFNGATCLL
jgi:hypothetical protein